MDTKGAVCSMGRAEVMGALKPGKVADFILLDRAPWRLPQPNRLR